MLCTAPLPLPGHSRTLRCFLCGLTRHGLRPLCTLTRHPWNRAHEPFILMLLWGACWGARGPESRLSRYRCLSRVDPQAGRGTQAACHGVSWAKCTRLPSEWGGREACSLLGAVAGMFPWQ